MMATRRAKVVVIGGYPPSLVNFRGTLLQSICAAGHAVTATAATNDESVREVLNAWGVRYVPVNLERAGLNPLSDRRYLQGVRNLMAAERPDIVLAYTHKPVIYSAMASAKLEHRPRVYSLITGLGFAFIGRSIKPWLAREVLKFLYRRVSHYFTGVFFQNPDDQALFRKLRLVRPGTPQCIVRGSGIDLSAFRFESLTAGPRSSTIRFLLIARLIGDKGIREYAAAARRVKAVHHQHAEFHLVGPSDPNPAAISQSEIEAWQRNGIIIHHGAQYDVRPFLNDCTVYVLPSYREGTPRTVIEAMATGRAVVTTDAPGCRETIFDAGPADALGVREGRNGFLVPVKSVNALAAAMQRFIDDPSLATRMGAEGRRLAEEHYDVHKVNRQMMEFMGLVSKS